MPDRPQPEASTHAETPLDRDAKIEELLLAGLDHYFNGQYEQAINVWTRVLFLDRCCLARPRVLLPSALERGGPRDEALAVLYRLSRLETVTGSSEGERHAR